MRLRVGDAFDEATIRAALIDGGYLVGDPIDMPGMATFLGQVFEIFSAGGLAPVRVSYEDGTIAEIHIYGIADGREVGESNEATIDVVNECGDGNVRRPCLTTIFLITYHALAGYSIMARLIVLTACSGKRAGIMMAHRLLLF